MALIKCSECKREVSDRAAACPSCGCPISSKNAKADLADLITSKSREFNNRGNTNTTQQNIRNENNTNVVLASPADRLIAYIITQLFFMPAIIISAYIIFGYFYLGIGYMELIFLIIAIIYYIIITCINIGYVIKGTSIGKQFVRLYVVDKDTGRILSVGKRIFLRTLIGKRFISLILCLGFLWILFDKEHQGWHDKLCNSVVVKKR